MRTGHLTHCLLAWLSKHTHRDRTDAGKQSGSPHPSTPLGPDSRWRRHIFQARGQRSPVSLPYKSGFVVSIPLHPVVFASSHLHQESRHNTPLRSNKRPPDVLQPSGITMPATAAKAMSRLSQVLLSGLAFLAEMTLAGFHQLSNTSCGSEDPLSSRRGSR